MTSYGEAEVRIPDVEVLIQAASSDVAMVSFYMPRDPHQDVEIVSTISEPSAIGAIRAVLQMAIQALYTQNWKSLDELDLGVVSQETAGLNQEDQPSS